MCGTVRNVCDWHQCFDLVFLIVLPKCALMLKDSIRYYTILIAQRHVMYLTGLFVPESTALCLSSISCVLPPPFLASTLSSPFSLPHSPCSTPSQDRFIALVHSPCLRGRSSAKLHRYRHLTDSDSSSGRVSCRGTMAKASISTLFTKKTWRVHLYYAHILFVPITDLWKAVGSDGQHSITREHIRDSLSKGIGQQECGFGWV